MGCSIIFCLTADCLGQTRFTSGEASSDNPPIFTVLLAHFHHDERLVPENPGVLLGFAESISDAAGIAAGVRFRGLGQMAVICSSILYSLAGISANGSGECRLW